MSYSITKTIQLVRLYNLESIDTKNKRIFKKIIFQNCLNNKKKKKG